MARVCMPVPQKVENGKFTLQVSMPAEISENFRPATANMYAISDDNSNSAIGVNKDFYVYGYDESAEEDTEAPVIESFYLNHSSFKSGDVVNTEPMAIAQISDNRGIKHVYGWYRSPTYTRARRLKNHIATCQTIIPPLPTALSLAPLTIPLVS